MPALKVATIVTTADPDDDSSEALTLCSDLHDDEDFHDDEELDLLVGRRRREMVYAHGRQADGKGSDISCLQATR